MTEQVSSESEEEKQLKSKKSIVKTRKLPKKMVYSKPRPLPTSPKPFLAGTKTIFSGIFLFYKICDYSSFKSRSQCHYYSI